MSRYCIDTNVFIQAKNGPYGFDIAPSFWDLLDAQFKAEVIFSTLLVHDELMEGNDELAAWARDRKEYFLKPNKEVQDAFRDIADYINQNYPVYEAQSFLDEADPWVIAHAKCENSIVVTNEVLVGSNSTKIKIPNICKHFDVANVNLYQMLRELKANIKL